MVWRYLPTLGLLGAVVAGHASSRGCSPPSLSGDDDAGAPMSEGVCAIGATQACNSYGNQTCVAAGGLSLSLGEWGPCSCPSTPTCSPRGSGSCGNCGTRTCNSCGEWSGCTNQGLCTPGDKGPDGCYEGEDAFCNQSCQWVCP